MLKHYAKLLDFPFDDNWAHVAFKEMKGKYSGTYIQYVDDSNVKKLGYISDIEEHRIHLADRYNGCKSYKEHNIIDLIPFTPPTGVYATPGFTSKGYIFAQRLAQKQWKRSLCWENYKLSFKSHETPFVLFDVIKDLKTSKHLFAIVDNGIYYLEQLVGSKSKDGKIEIHPLFYQEWIDVFGAENVHPVEKFTKPKKTNTGVESLGKYMKGKSELFTATVGSTIDTGNNSSSFNQWFIDVSTTNTTTTTKVPLYTPMYTIDTAIVDEFDFVEDEQGD